MYRLVLIVALLLFLVFLVRQIYRGRPAGRQSPATSEDQMVEDPVCHVFIPRKTAVIRKRDHATQYFCSQACADEFERTSQN